MDDRRSEPRIILDFEEFPLKAEFYSGIDYYFKGDIQNISPSGLSIVYLETHTRVSENVIGNLSISKNNKTLTVPAKVKWVNKPNGFVRYVGLETPPKLLFPVLDEFL